MRSLQELRQAPAPNDANDLEVSVDEFNYLISLPEVLCTDGRPKAPIKREESCGKFGAVDYDREAPEYIEALAEWKAGDTSHKHYFMGRKLVVK